MASLQGLKGHDLIYFLFPKTEVWGRNAGTLCLKYTRAEAGPEELLGLLRSCAWEERLPESPDSVRILALSQAKALEAKIVIVAGCVYGMIPDTNQDSGTTEGHKAKLKEQRRLLYVAITRATEQVVLSTFVGMPRDWSPDYRVELAPGSGSWGATLSSSFLNNMRPVLPKSISGKAWRQWGYPK
jgi:superfamily I DNA/RNA helicase